MTDASNPPALGAATSYVVASPAAATSSPAAAKPRPERSALTLGPVLFNWPAETWRDFYFRIADEAAVDTVYVGETICSKRTPLFEPFADEVVTRLERGGKTVVLSTLAEIMIDRERRMVAETCTASPAEGEANDRTADAHRIEANDAAALYHLRGRPHAIGPFFNTYNERSLAVLARHGATHVTLPAELPASAIAAMAPHAAAAGVTLEVLVYGRMPLALSARCYHARAHDRVKDNCQFVCGQDPDGLVLTTTDGTPFLAVNGVQTLSYTCLNLVQELPALREMGIAAFRLSPHHHDMVRTAALFRAVLDGTTAPAEALAGLRDIGLEAPFANGFYHRRPGHDWVRAA